MSISFNRVHYRDPLVKDESVCLGRPITGIVTGFPRDEKIVSGTGERNNRSITSALGGSVRAGSQGEQGGSCMLSADVENHQFKIRDVVG
ncbi:hypothetical protein RRG08_025347 [Elysia crispata]|uniref:Uncharacterized protein n=1 Tax=Elysia crispata TaxID=231223 RepID=A0AAE1A9D2_9GAST|nr:hypothetical protein RRG08_025347 [Elysia crispata]